MLVKVIRGSTGYTFYMHSEETLMIDPLQQEPQTGDLVNGFLLGQLLGRGANGAVYLATKNGVPGNFAIKIIETQGHQRAFVDRILRECSITTKLRHPGIISVHEAGHWGSCVYIVMDVATGRSCDQFGDGRLGWELSLEIARRVGRALEHAFVTAHVIHRDIKPANIVVDLAGGVLRSVNVVDFGLSRQVDEEGDNLTMTGMVLGTPYYMSPEQARGDRDISFETDLYALGATLFFLIAGRPPFQNGTAVEILVKQCNDAPPKLSDIALRCPPRVSELVDRCLRKERGERFASYAEFLAQIDAILGGDPFEAAAPGAPASVNQPQTIFTNRVGNRAVRDPSASSTPTLPPDAPGSAPTIQQHRRDQGDGSSSDGSDALSNLLRGKLVETTRTFRKPGGGPPPEAPRRPELRAPPRPLVPAVAAPPASVPGPPPAVNKRPPSLENGSLIDSAYTVLDPIGAGAMGEVYAVEDRFTNRQLALKILSEEDMRRPGAVKRFHGECSALATVDHPAFPFFAGKGNYRGRDYLLMEQVNGVDLKTWLQRNGNRMSEQGALLVVQQLAEALDRAYAKCGMVHRDIKPANLMFTTIEGRQRVKIIDFGVSTYIDYGDFEDFSEREYRYIDDDSQGKAVGTPAFMSPEQCVGAPPSPLMDIYAIGCVFFQLIAGRTPYKAPNAAMMMMKHLKDAPPTFDGVAEVSSGANYLLKRCMAKHPKDRFRNYQQVIAAVSSAQFSLSTRIRRAAAPPGVPSPPGTGLFRRPNP